MTAPNSSRLSELDAADVLRRRAAEMHQAVDNWLALTAHELGVKLEEHAPTPTVGISFESTLQLKRQPQLEDLTRLGFYCPNPTRQVEVVYSLTPGKVLFEIADDNGQITTMSMDEDLFALLFQWRSIQQQVDKTPRSDGVSYSLHPTQRDVAVRHNPDGSITLGRYGDSGEFIPNTA